MNDPEILDFFYKHMQSIQDNDGTCFTDHDVHPILCEVGG